MLNQDKCWDAICAHDASRTGNLSMPSRRPGCIAGRAALRVSRDARTSRSSRPEKRRRRRGSARASAVGRTRARRRPVTSPPSNAPARSAAATLPSLDELANAAGISRYPSTRLQADHRRDPREWGKAHRLERYRRLDAGEEGDQAIYAAGFDASSRAYEATPSGLGMTPTARRHGGRGETIEFATVKTASAGLWWPRPSAASA